MVQEGDRAIFPTVGRFIDPDTGREVIGEKTVTDTITGIEPRDENRVTFRSDEGELGLDLEKRGRRRLSDLGDKPGSDTVTADDVFIEPQDRNKNGIDPAEIHSERSYEAQIADEAKDATITTDEEQWASDPSDWDYPGVDTGPVFEENFDSDFSSF